MSTRTHNNQTNNEKEQIRKAGGERKSQQQDQTFQPHPTDAFQRVTHAPPSAMRPADVLALQSSVGNRAVQRLVERAQHRAGDPGVIQRRFITEAMQEDADIWLDILASSRTVFGFMGWNVRPQPMREGDEPWSLIFSRGGGSSVSGGARERIEAGEDGYD